MRRGLSFARGLLGGVVVLTALAAAALAVTKLLPSLNPFGTETKDRSQPALLQSLQKLSEYRAATANLQQVVDVERDTKLVPSFLKGERTLLVASGQVAASVDFRNLDARALRVSEDRRSVRITLPAARLAPARIDLARTRVVDHDEGLIDRAGKLVGGDDADRERRLLLVAQRKLDAAAAADPRLLPMAQRNTAQMLRRLARGLGFERVDVRFAPPAV